MKRPTRRADARPTKPESVRQLARRHGLRASTVSERLARGWSLDQALTTPADARHGRRTGVSAAARAAGLPRTTVTQRLARGWSLDQALSTPIRASWRHASPGQAPEGPGADRIG